VPRQSAVPFPFRIIQLPGFTAILYEYGTTYRQIFTDGRKLPRNPNPTWMGYSISKWDGDTLVVETRVEGRAENGRDANHRETALMFPMAEAQPHV
jgi:hypothetical protein